MLSKSQPCVALGEDTNIKCSCLAKRYEARNADSAEGALKASGCFLHCQEQLDPALLAFGARQTPKAHQTLYGFSLAPF